MKNILVLTDFSFNAANALDYAVQLVTRVHGNLILFHNAELPINYTGTHIYAAAAGDVGLGATPLYSGAIFPDPEIEKAQQKKLAELSQKIQENAHPSIPVKIAYRLGSLTENLRDIIREEQINLVVMGTKGSSSFLDRLVGSNTASVIKENLGVPVLAIPGLARFTEPKNLFFATDLTAETGLFLNHLFAFSQPLGATVTLVHVKTDKRPEHLNGTQMLAELRTRFPEYNLDLVELTDGKVAHGLEIFLQNNTPAILAVGIHEHGFWYSLFHTSVTEELIFHSQLPLLALPPTLANPIKL